MQVKITSFLIYFLAACLPWIEARPQTINNYPFRPTFSELDTYNYYYTTPMTYPQSLIQVWPYVIDQAVSPLYNLNQQSNNGYGYGSNAFPNSYNQYQNTGVAYNPLAYGNTQTQYNSNGYGNVYNPGYGYTTMPSYLSYTNPFGIYNGKK